MPEDVKKIVFRHGKVHTRRTVGSRDAVSLAAGVPVGDALLAGVIIFDGCVITRRQLVVGMLAAVPKTPQAHLAVRIDERSSCRVGDKDNARPNTSDWLLPIILWYSVFTW